MCKKCSFSVSVMPAYRVCRNRAEVGHPTPSYGSLVRLASESRAPHEAYASSGKALSLLRVPALRAARPLFSFFARCAQADKLKTGPAPIKKNVSQALFRGNTNLALLLCLYIFPTRPAIRVQCICFLSPFLSKYCRLSSASLHPEKRYASVLRGSAKGRLCPARSSNILANVGICRFLKPFCRLIQKKCTKKLRVFGKSKIFVTRKFTPSNSDNFRLLLTF